MMGSCSSPNQLVHHDSKNDPITMAIGPKIVVGNDAVVVGKG